MDLLRLGGRGRSSDSGTVLLRGTDRGTWSRNPGRKKDDDDDDDDTGLEGGKQVIVFWAAPCIP
jgi:hypothetical protein